MSIHYTNEMSISIAKENICFTTITIGIVNEWSGFTII